MSKPPCDGCHKPIKDGQASISANTLTTKEHWHLGCCPWLLKHAVMSEDARGQLTSGTTENRNNGRTTKAPGVDRGPCELASLPAGLPVS